MESFLLCTEQLPELVCPELLAGTTNSVVLNIHVIGVGQFKEIIRLVEIE